MFPFFSLLMISTQHWTLLGYVLTTGSLQSWQITTCHLCTCSNSWKYRNDQTLTCFFKLVSTKSCHTGFDTSCPQAIRLRPTIDRTLKWKCESANHIDTKHNCLEMEYRNYKKKYVLQGAWPPSHSILQALWPLLRRDSGALISS